jgi:hypothetical protein
MKDREEQRATLTEQVAALVTDAQAVPTDLGKVHAQLRAYLDEWRKLLSKHVGQARQILRKLVDGKLVFTPKENANGKRYYEFTGQATLGRLLEGASLFPKAWVSPDFL